MPGMHQRQEQQPRCNCNTRKNILRRKIYGRNLYFDSEIQSPNTIQFYPDAIQKGIKAIQNGCQIFTDTNMARVGIRQKEIHEFGGKVSCLIADKDVADKAKDTGTTRALAAVDMACDRMKDGIYVVGNAPTALLRLIELIKDKKASSALIIGFPVGFVNAAESKDALMTLDFPYITNKGRKGGSNIAASIVNALAIMAFEQR